MGSKFQPLFTVQALHDYYNRHNNQCNDFDIVPSEDCKKLMKNLKILYKNFGNKLLTLIQAVEEANATPPPDFNLKPFISFHPRMVFRFYMVCKNMHFANLTALSLDYAERKRFYFSNLSKNNVGSVLALSAPVPDFNNSNNYLPGDIVKNLSNNFFESVRVSDGTAASQNLSNTDYWIQAADTHPYVNNLDQVIIAGETYTYKLVTPALSITINVFDINISNINLPFDNPVFTETRVFTQLQQTVNIKLTGLEPGKYRLSVNGEADVWLYVDPVAVKQNISGIIEVHHFQNVPAVFKLLTTQNHVKIPEPVYTIRFKNRSVIWKYISQNGNIGVIDSGSTPLVFTPASGLNVQSQRAIGLKETPVSTLTAARTPAGKQLKNLKNPEPEKLVFEKNGNTGYYISNMYVRIEN